MVVFTIEAQKLHQETADGIRGEPGHNTTAETAGLNPIPFGYA
jgi:hypothetical protein